MIGTERYISMGNADLSPLISRLRDKLLAVFFPPKGKPFIRPCEHGEYNFGKQTKNSRNKQNYRSNQASEFPLARPVVKNEGGCKGFPLGGSWRVSD